MTLTIYLRILYIFLLVYCKCYDVTVKVKLYFVHYNSSLVSHQTQIFAKNQLIHNALIYENPNWMKWFNLQFKIFYDLSTHFYIFLFDGMDSISNYLHFFFYFVWISLYGKVWRTFHSKFYGFIAFQWITRSLCVFFFLLSWFFSVFLFYLWPNNNLVNHFMLKEKMLVWFLMLFFWNFKPSSYSKKKRKCFY